MRPDAATYRRDIDGLRALAIGPVLLFHLFPSVLPGGFIGVDIFFVISGYLISGILLRQLQVGQFSIRTFYAQRIKRIFPALSVVVLATFVMGWLLATPEDFKLIGKHMATGAGFVQNFALLGEAGYFDVASESKPLMHLWSLAIEEQFYLLYPPLLWLLWRRPALLRPALALLALASMTLNLATVGHDATQAFFSPQTRFWELLCGGLVAASQTLPQGTGGTDTPPSAMWRQAMSCTGLGLVVIGLATITPSLAFPGWAALLPVAGAVLLIQAGPGAWVNRTVLSHPAAVQLGLISYPLYLWHWPVLACLYITNAATTPHRLAAGIASIVLAWLTYRFIETPIRQRPTRRLTLGLLVSAMVLLAGLGVNTWQRDGLEFRFNHLLGTRTPLAKVPHMAAGCGIQKTSPEVAGMEIANCLHDDRAPARYALLGDSKAAALAYGLLARSTPEHPWMMLGGNNGHGAPTPVLSDDPLRARTQPLLNMALDALTRTPSVEVVVVTGAARSLFLLQSDHSIEDLQASPHGDEAERGLIRTVERLLAAGKKVVLTVDNPTLLDPRRCLTRGLDLVHLRITTHFRDTPGCSQSLDTHLRLSARYRDLLTRVQARHPDRVRIFDPTHLLCDMQTRTCGHRMGDTVLYSYTDHISNQASSVIAQELTPLVMAFAAETPPAR